jgi:mannosyltransferase OCH1-like enzyme
MNTQLVESITQMIESLTPEEKDLLTQKIKPILQDKDIPKASHFQEIASPQEWNNAFQQWIDSHKHKNLPSLSDEAMSRESIYGERG